MSDKIELRAEVPSELGGQRLDQVAAQLFAEHSRSRLSAWIKDGRLTVDGAVIRPRDIVHGGAILELTAEQEAQGDNDLPTPYRRYQVGPVWRDEKPGPGRFRQFTQCDADTVGAASVAADAEVCAMLADALEAAGIARGEYVVEDQRPQGAQRRTCQAAAGQQG